jgi:hypothetical protein
LFVIGTALNIGGFMWQVENNTPFAAQAYFVRDQNGFEHWVVALRASFLIHSTGALVIDEPQEPVKLAPVYGDSQAQELTIESDLAPFRPGVDFTVSGMAVAPNSRPFRQLLIGFRIGAAAKMAMAFGRRIIKKTSGKRSSDWILYRDEAVDSVPLSWRMAMGGLDPLVTPGHVVTYEFNPIGKGWLHRYDLVPEGTLLDLPQIENVGQFFQPSSPPPLPFGFGALQPGWRPRLDYAGTYDSAWERHRAPLLPTDFSPRFYNAVSADQVLDLRGGEAIALEGLHPEGSYQFSLPRLFFRATTHLGREKPSSAMRLIAVQIDATTKRLGMVWNAQVPCNNKDHKVEKTVVVMKRVIGAAT